YTEEIWNRTITLLKKILIPLWNNQIMIDKDKEQFIPIPIVYPDFADNSFDFYWNKITQLR
ncbi:MAG: hypothetical protein ACFFBK_00890, partial [Promethearchaeota archaeon]